MILCVGEILCDMTGSVQSGKTVYEQNAGGAPFNVACAAAKFGTESAFVGCVGDDLMGIFLERFAHTQGLKELYLRRDLRRDPRRNTTLAFVSLDEHGDRSFCFYRKDTADYHLPAVPDDLLGRAHIVHVGSLMLSERTGRLYAEELMRRARGAGKLVSFDVNFRSDIFRNTRAAVNVYREIIVLADIVKFSEEGEGLRMALRRRETRAPCDRCQARRYDGRGRRFLCGRAFAAGRHFSRPMDGGKAG